MTESEYPLTQNADFALFVGTRFGRLPVVRAPQSLDFGEIGGVSDCWMDPSTRNGSFPLIHSSEARD